VRVLQLMLFALGTVLLAAAGIFSAVQQYHDGDAA
jgi:hypothetical protein